MSITVFKALIPGNQCRGSHINASLEVMQIYSCAKPPVSVVTHVRQYVVVKSIHCSLILKMRLFKHISTQSDSLWLTDNPCLEVKFQEIVQFAVLAISGQELYKTVFNFLFTKW